jgi:hypothetical protein
MICCYAENKKLSLVVVRIIWILFVATAATIFVFSVDYKIPKQDPFADYF